MPKFRCGKSFGSVILLKNKKCGMVNKSVAWGIGEKEGRGKVEIVLKNKTKIQFTGKKTFLHTSFWFNCEIFIKCCAWMFCRMIYTVNHLTICSGRLRVACNQLVTQYPTTVVIGTYPVIVISPHTFNLSFLVGKIFLILLVM